MGGLKTMGWESGVPRRPLNRPSGAPSEEHGVHPEGWLGPDHMRKRLPDRVSCSHGRSAVGAEVLPGGAGTGGAWGPGANPTEAVGGWGPSVGQPGSCAPEAAAALWGVAQMTLRGSERQVVGCPAGCSPEGQAWGVSGALGSEGPVERPPWVQRVMRGCGKGPFG